MLLDDDNAADTVRASLLPALQAAGFELQIRTWNEMSTFYSSVHGLFTMIFAFIFGIVMVVVTMSIINAMSMTVVERTREIGLRKAIGAKRGDISLQFLIESVMLTFTGGAIGIALGWGISFAVTKLGILQTSVSVGSILLAFGVSTLIGIVFGYYPARRASRLNPIEALRYE